MSEEELNLEEELEHLEEELEHLEEELEHLEDEDEDKNDDDDNTKDGGHHEEKDELEKLPELNLEDEDEDENDEDDNTKDGGHHEEKDELEKLPELSLARCGIPSVDALFDSIQEALDTSTTTNNNIVETVNKFYTNLASGECDFGEEAPVEAAEGDVEGEGNGGEGEEAALKTGSGMMPKVKGFVRVFIKVCREMLSDITACLPHMDFALIKEGKFKLIWPTLAFDKLSDELRPLAEKAWKWIQDLVNEVKDHICGAFAKVPQIIKAFMDGCKNLSITKILSEAKQNCNSLSDAKKMGSAAQRSMKTTKNNVANFAKTLASNASRPMMAVLAGFKQALSHIQADVFKNVPEGKSKGLGFPSFSREQTDAVDPNQQLKELPRLGVHDVGVPEIDAVFAKLKDIFDTIVDANNNVIAKVKEIPGAESGACLQYVISSTVYDAEDAMKWPMCSCIFGGKPKAKVDAKWDKLKSGNIKLQLPRFNLSKLEDGARIGVEKMMSLAKAAIDIIKNAFKAVPAKVKELAAALKKFTPSKIKSIVKKAVDNVAEIPQRAMWCAENCKLAVFIMKAIASFFVTITIIAKAIKDGFAAGIQAIKCMTHPVSSTE